VFVKDKGDKLVETKLCIPKWVNENVMRILRQREMESWMKKMDHEKDNSVRDLGRDVVGMKKEMNKERYSCPV
jgi:hypothetical protein